MKKLLTFLFILVFVFAGTVSADTLTRQDQTIYGKKTFDHDAAFKGKNSSKYGIPIRLPLTSWTLTNAAVSTSSEPRLQFYGRGFNSSGALVWTVGGLGLDSLDPTTYSKTYLTERDYTAVANFRIPEDYDPKKSAEFAVLVQHFYEYDLATTNRNIMIDYAYYASADGTANDGTQTAADGTPTHGKRVALAGHNSPQWLTLSCPDVFTAGGWGRVLVWRSRYGYPGGSLKLMDAALLINKN